MFECSGKPAVGKLALIYSESSGGKFCLFATIVEVSPSGSIRADWKDGTGYAILSLFQWIDR